MCEPFFFFFFLHYYAMQYVTLGRTCARGIGRELSKCVTTSTSVSSLTAQLATSLVTEQLSRGTQNIINSVYSDPYARSVTLTTRSDAKLEGEEQVTFFGIILNAINTHHLKIQ